MLNISNIELLTVTHKAYSSAVYVSLLFTSDRGH